MKRRNGVVLINSRCNDNRMSKGILDFYNYSNEFFHVFNVMLSW